MTAIDRPLKLGELLAETIRIYGERTFGALSLGAVVAGAFLLTVVAPPALDVAVVSLALTLGYAVAARLVSGDRPVEAWAQAVLRLPMLAVLGFIVAVPVTIALGSFLELIVFAAAWLGLIGFSIPVAMLERPPESSSWFQGLAYVLRRSVDLARTRYLHAAGAAGVLLLIYLMVGILISAVLAGFADNDGVGAAVLVQVVLAPFFFIGLSVLYFEQRARSAQAAPG